MKNTFPHLITTLVGLICLLLLQNTTIFASSIQSQFASKNFWLLNQALSVYQHASLEPWVEIPSEPRILKIGTKSRVVPLLRARLKMTGDLAEINDTGGRRFDRQLANAVEIFQTRHGLKVDGAVGKDTRDHLNIPPDIRIKQIALNLQRWADLFNKLGDRFIIVNIPDFHMYLYENDQQILSLRAIVGKRDLQTPEITSKIYRIVLNPYWNIPDKIAKNDIAPKMLADPNYIYRMHIRAFRQEDNDATEINPDLIDWQSATRNGLNYHLRQDPGPENALGLVKFEFQNSHDVYMHDTSAKNLFDTAIRDYSHGCIRLENPFALVEYLMKDSLWDNERIRDVLETGKTKYIKIPRPIPIFITYITAWVDEEGLINFRDDIYQQDAEILSPGSVSLNNEVQENPPKQEQLLYTY